MTPQDPPAPMPDVPSLNLHLPEIQKRIEEIRLDLEDKDQDFLQVVRRTEQITSKDMAIRINTRG